MTHIEDKVLYGGVNGTRQAIMALRDLRDMLAGVHKGSVSVKWDGAPAVFAGTDPTDGRFFVAKKGIFNKNPKVYKTAKEVDADTSGDLADKLKAALRYFPSLGITGVVQGDLLFTNDLKTETIQGHKYTTFHPNTIIYAVPYESPEAAVIRKAKIGVVWHTTYTGNTFESMKASYGVDVSKFKKSSTVWSQDAMLRDLTNVTMSVSDTEEVNEYLRKAGEIFNKIAGTTLRQLQASPELSQSIETYNNSFVRRGEIPGNSKAHASGLIGHIKAKWQKEIDKLKSTKGKESKSKSRDEQISFFSNENIASLIMIFELQKVIVLAKLKLINNLNRLQKIDTFVKTRDGFKVTGAEGFVAIDRLGSDAVKIVDRMEFSYNNFSADIVKGWDKPGR